MKTIATAGTIQEAQALKFKLASFGIESFIPDETSATLLPGISTPEGVKVQVEEKDAELALEKLAEGEDASIGFGVDA